MEHVRYSCEQHASCSLQVAGNPTALRLPGNTGTVLFLPCTESSQKGIAIRFGIDGKHLQEEVAQMFAIGSLRETSAPPQPLSLNMDQASLDNDIGPVGAQNP